MQKRLVTKQATGFVDKAFNDKIELVKKARELGLTIDEYKRVVEHKPR